MNDDNIKRKKKDIYIFGARMVHCKSKEIYTNFFSRAKETVKKGGKHVNIYKSKEAP